MKYLVYITILMLSGSFIQAKRTRAQIRQHQAPVRAATPAIAPAPAVTVIVMNGGLSLAETQFRQQQRYAAALRTGMQQTEAMLANINLPTSASAAMANAIILAQLHGARAAHAQALQDLNNQNEQ